MKKLINLSLILLVAFSLVACSSPSTNDSSKTTLTMWAHQNEPWNNSYQDIIDKFEDANPDIKITLETFPYDDFESKVQTSLIDGKGGADIYELWGGWALDFAPTGALAEVPAALATKVQEETFAPTYGALLSDGKLYGVPLEFNIEVGGMIVNLGLLEEANLTVPTTWAELRSTAIAGTQHDGNVFQVKGFDFVNWDSVPYYFLSLILQQGGSYMNADGTAFTLETPEAKKAFTELAAMVTEDKVTDLLGLTGGEDLEGYQQLYANRALMVPRGPWVISEGVESFELVFGEDFDYAAVPWYGTPAFAAETGWSLAVNAKSDKQEAAMKFVEFMYQDENLLQHNIRSTQIPSKISISEDPAYVEAMPYTDILLDILGDAQFIGHFNTDRLKEAINNAFVDYVSNGGSIDDAMTQLNAELNGILE